MYATLSSLHLNLPDETATAALASRLARAMQVTGTGEGGRGGVIHLSGPLGAGKTHFTRALLRALGHTGRVRSPSFTLMEPYELDGLDVHHFDFYRFTGREEWREAGFDEMIAAPGTLSLIEWPEMAAQSLQTPDLTLQLVHLAGGDGDARDAQLQAHSALGQRWLQGLKDA